MQNEPLTRCNVRQEVLAVAALAAVLFSPVAGADGAAAPAADPSHALAVWVPLQLTFPYRHVTTQYSCSGLENRMKSLLLKLGARPDLEVRGYGCTQLSGPDPLAGVKIRMSVLEPAGARPGLGAHWQRVDLLDDRDTPEAAGDCELIEQVAQKILPLFTRRNIDYHASCQARTLVPGAVRLQAEVLVADQKAASVSASIPPGAPLQR